MPEWVVQTRYQGAGRIGVVLTGQGRRHQVKVQFGADGPVKKISRVNLRAATREEIAQARGIHPMHVDEDDLVGLKQEDECRSRS